MPDDTPRSHIEVPSAPSTQLTIIVHLPQPLDTIARLLDALNREWPGVPIDYSHPDGWRITVPADEPKHTGAFT